MPPVADAAFDDAGDAPAGRSLVGDAIARLRRNRAAVASLVVLGCITALCLAGEHITGHDPTAIDWDNIAIPPSFEKGYLLGTDNNGRDMLTRILHGGRVSLLVGVVATAVSLVIGMTVGISSGFIGGRFDQIVMRLVEVLYAMPFLFFVILLTVLFGRSFILIFVAIGAVEWLDIARIARAQTLTLKRREFVDAARLMGVGSGRIMLSHILPNSLGVTIVYVTLTVPKVILLESYLSFLGLGIQEPSSSWGVLISDGAKTMSAAPWMLIYPAIFLVATIFSLNFIGDGLRDAFDPKER